MSMVYALNGIYSAKSNVFSFIVVLLEIISGKKKKIHEFFRSELSISLLGYVSAFNLFFFL